ncbi:MAG: hypothetical protein GVY13_06355 [Alphaproteobacteria bacterium]|jgi:hypothetical protein|nr:hypothetical protein [Alphaproteobacteria bacterium]
MYQLIPATWRTTALTLFGVLAICAMGVPEWFGLAMSPYQVAAALAILVLGLLAVAFGSSNYHSPWRWLWRKMPILNKALFPDLNGVWVGTTRSNWPVIRNLLDAAKGEVLSVKDSHDVPLQENGMALIIDANLFRVNIKAYVASTSGNSRSITFALDRYPTDKDIRLTYLYKQKTPDPRQSDESEHFGAASLCFENANFDKCDGFYWNRRKWREGMNTAGILEFVRKTDNYDPKKHDLFQFAKTDF